MATTVLSAPEDDEVARRQRRGAFWKAVTPWLFVSPFVVLFLAFTLFPVVFSIYLSFHKWNPVEGLETMQFVGLQNYVLAITDPLLWKSLWNTLWLGLVGGVPQHVVAVPIAYLLVNAMSGRMRHIYSASMFVPFITSTVAVALIFFTIYSQNSGILNQTLVWLSTLPVIGWLFAWAPGAMPIRWLGQADLIKPAIAFVIFWKYVGFNVVIYSAGFLTVPQDLYDAAKVDGCTPFRQFWSVALPMIRPFIFFGATLTIIGSMQLFEEPFVLTQGRNGGTSQAGLTAAYYLYQVGWQWLEMGSAAALSWILFIIIAIATAIHFYFNGRQGLGGN